MRYELKNLYVYDNSVSVDTGFSGNLDYATGRPSLDPSWNNRFEYNTYSLSPSGGDFFRWDDANPATQAYDLYTLTEWQQIHPNDG